MKRFFLWLVPLAILVAFAGLHLWPEGEEPEPQTVASPASVPEPAIRYPVEADQSPPAPLPSLADSDETIHDGVTALLGQEQLPDFLNLKNLIHRVVATVDNLPRDHLSLRLLPVKPVAGLPETQMVGDDLVLSSRNAARYHAYVRLTDTVPTNLLVTAYTRLYPLFQEQYERLGYPDKYFNDRVIEVIDHLLTTPEVREPIRLAQPRVLYEFADPKLESLSAGQKILLRIGKTNRDKLKIKLQEVRQALVSMAPEE